MHHRLPRHCTTAPLCKLVPKRSDPNPTSIPIPIPNSNSNSNPTLGDNGGGSFQSALNAQAINPTTNVMLSFKLNEGNNGQAWPEW